MNQINLRTDKNLQFKKRKRGKYYNNIKICGEKNAIKHQLNKLTKNGLKFEIIRTFPKTDFRKPPPQNVTILKGSRYVALRRDFVDFILNNDFVKVFYDWIVDMNTADESFCSTLATLNVTEKGEVIQDLTKNTTHGQV